MRSNNTRKFSKLTKRVINRFFVSLLTLFAVLVGGYFVAWMICMQFSWSGHKAMSEALAAMDVVPEEPRNVTVVGGNCWVRTAPNTEGTKLGVAHAGETYSFGGQTSDDGWLLIAFVNQNGWISGKYGRLI